MNDLSEKEQLEELRAWWAENGWFVIGGLVLGITLLVGWNLWQDQRATARLEASAAYEALVEAVADGDLAPAETLAAELFASYGATPYAAQGRLAMARLYMDRGRDQDAADTLRPLATADGDEILALIARHRLAKVLLYQGKPQEVLDLIGTPAETAFEARFNEAIGDAHYALGNLEAAASAYRSVLADGGAAQTVNTGFVQMKLDDLPASGAPDAPAAEDLPTAEETE